MCTADQMLHTLTLLRCVQGFRLQPGAVNEVKPSLLRYLGSRAESLCWHSC